MKRYLKNISQKYSHKTSSKAAKINLDPHYYRTKYDDLREFSDEQLLQHWLNHGYSEGRYASTAHEAGLIDEKSDKNLTKYKIDIDFITHVYPKKMPKTWKTDEQLKLLLSKTLEDGKFHLSFQSWAESHGLCNSISARIKPLLEIIKDKKNEQLNLTGQQILETLLGRNVLPIYFLDSAKENAHLYTDVAISLLSNGNRNDARNLLRVAYTFTQDIHPIQIIANTFFDERKYTQAETYYLEIINSEKHNKWDFLNLARSQFHQEKVEHGIKTLLQGIKLYPSWSIFFDELDTYAEKYWEGFLDKCNIDIDLNDRDKLYTRTEEFSRFLFNAYSESIIKIGSERPVNRQQSSTKKVLIIGDYHIGQCIRYRIDQKVEQLKLAGYQVECIDWTKIKRSGHFAAFYPNIIFYRVPAIPTVIKAMAIAQSVGSTTYYDIDDLIFDPIYPASQNSYGGYVNHSEYQGLVRGGALTYAAIKLCEYGIASTKPLVKNLESHVNKQVAFLHRNGLDHLNRYREKYPNKESSDITLFYGSGTKAHNTDFIETALSPLTRIMSEDPCCKLLIVGELKLPQAFISKHREQVIQVNKTKTIEEYWELLKLADINLAPLLKDQINDSKSELKWFEAACFSVPSIMSSTENYIDVVKNGTDGLLATTQEDWYHHLKTLIQSPDRRKKIGANAYKRVREEYSPHAHSKKLNLILENQKIESETPKQKTKIALVNVFFSPQNIGGATRVLMDNFHYLLAEHSSEFELVVFCADAEHRDQHQTQISYVNGVKVYRVSTLWRPNMDWHSKDPEMGLIFKAFLEREEPDLIHFHCIQRLTGSIVEAALEHETPYFVTLHDAWWISDFQFLVDQNGKVYPEGHPPNDTTPSLPDGVDTAESKTRKLYLKNLLNKADQVFSVSEKFTQIYKKNGISAVQTCKNGVSDSIVWQPKDTVGTPKVVCAHIGGMSNHKGYHLFEQAIKKLQPNNIAVLAVDHSKDESYENETQWGDVPVTIRGRQKQEDIAKIYQKIDVLFAPSIWPESFGLVTREAAASGCWVVASKLGGIAEDITEGETGYSVSPDLDSVYEVIKKIDSSPESFKAIVSPKKMRTASEQAEELAMHYSKLAQRSNTSCEETRKDYV
ncbi:glycosyltransferase [Microbulbifer agarilyticus]